MRTATLLLAGLTKDSLRNMIPKLAVLKRIIREKKSAVNQSFRKFLTCDPVVHSPQFNQKWSSCKIFQKKPEKILM